MTDAAALAYHYVRFFAIFSSGVATAIVGIWIDAPAAVTVVAAAVVIGVLVFALPYPNEVDPGQ